MVLSFWKTLRECNKLGEEEGEERWEEPGNKEVSDQPLRSQKNYAIFLFMCSKKIIRNEVLLIN